MGENDLFEWVGRPFSFGGLFELGVGLDFVLVLARSGVSKLESLWIFLRWL